MRALYRCTAVTNERELARKLKGQIEHVLMNGFWFCEGCDRMCEREEGEQGQPAHCQRCGSPRINWNPPAYKPEMGMADFFGLPEVQALVEIQKRNGYGSQAHRAAFERLSAMAKAVGGDLGDYGP